MNFLLFRGDYWIPSGGWDDLYGRFDTLEEAKAADKAASGTWADIVDLKAGKIVARRGGDDEWRHE